MTHLVQTGQELNSRAKTLGNSISWMSVHILYLFIYISCSYLSRRVVPSINIPLLPSKWRLLIIKIQNLLFSCVLTKPERDLYPFALVFSFAEITEAAASSAPNPCSWSIDSRLRRLVLWECGWANPWFRLPYRDGGWLLVRVVRLH